MMFHRGDHFFVVDSRGSHFGDEVMALESWAANKTVPFSRADKVHVIAKILAQVMQEANNGWTDTQ